MKTLLLHARHNAIAYVALFLALSMGTAWALGKNTVKSKNIVNGQVKAKDLAKNSVKSKNIVNGQVEAKDLADPIFTDIEPRGLTSPSTSEDKTFVAPCPENKVPLQGGAAIEGGDGFVALTASQPVNPPETPEPGWRVSAIEVNGGTTESWSVIVSLFCASYGG